MRHSRSKLFQDALASFVPGTPGPKRWTDVAADPNHPAALVRRAEVLRQAWRPPIGDRLEFVANRCAGKHVLDIGCVAHDVARMSSQQWLHGRVAAVAASCVGVDVLDEGVEHMRAIGFDAMSHDLREGLGPLAERDPFDVIVAGELIEHVEAIEMLFATAAAALAPGGEMIITTPNPYSPARVRAGQRGIVWENVDHILYAFPSGIAELCERHGLVLAEAATTVDAGPVGLARRLQLLKRRVRGGQWANVGYVTGGSRRSHPVGGNVVTRLIERVAHRRGRFVGETFLYVIRLS